MRMRFFFVARRAARKSSSASGAGFAIAATLPCALPVETSYRSKSARVSPTNCLPKLGIPQLRGVLAGHLLDVEASDGPVEGPATTKTWIPPYWPFWLTPWM